MDLDYHSIKISVTKAAEIAEKFFKVNGKITPLPGELDFNFKIKTDNESYILKISRPGEDIYYIDYQQQLLSHLNKSRLNIPAPQIIPDIAGNTLSSIRDENGNKRLVRLLSWIDGRLWSSVNPIQENLLFSLGEETGKIAAALEEFEHRQAFREIEWDVAQVSWTKEYFHLFTPIQKDIVDYFYSSFENSKDEYEKLRKGVVHNDANDNNVVVTNDFINPKVKAVIDYGDAIHTQIINDLAIAIAYAIMEKPNPLDAALPIVSGYNNSMPLQEQELKFLFNLVAMRLIISVTKSAINKQKEPDNKYLLISEKPAWEVLEKWMKIHPEMAHYFFRKACGYSAHPNFDSFNNWTKNQNFYVNDLFPELKIKAVENIDMSVSSTSIGHEFEYSNLKLTQFKIDQLKENKPNILIAGGYKEIRPFYSTDAYKREGNNGPEYRTMHLGVDFWVDPETPIHAFTEAKVYSIYNNDFDKDYGPTLILEHQTDIGLVFYSLYGHLTKTSLDLFEKGDIIKKGDLIGYVGSDTENGNWTPHLHFQLMLDMLGFKHDFPGVCFPNESDVWTNLCPDPNLLFKNENLEQKEDSPKEEVIAYRKKHLGKSLSLSYKEPLKMVRGNGAFLIDNTGRKYLDTVNNVAHVGHEHPRVVKAGQQQMAVLNTNSRYLHENINEFAKELLATFPEELSVAHFVNSGSEANELALRMAKSVTNAKDMIAMEIGYHGNTNGCIEISSYKFDGKGGKGTPEHTHIVPLPDAFRGIYQGDNTGPKYAAHVKEQIENIKSKGRNVAGFICESIISCGGQIELPKDFLKIAYEGIRNAGGICISDEVQVGVGRVGEKFWGFQLHNVIPDIVTIGKPIGNGHPLAAVVCTQEVADAFANGMEYFNTFGGNPVSCAIGREVLRVVKDENLQENALNIGNYLKSSLLELQKEFPIIGDVRGQGLFLGFELVDENKNPLTDKAAYLANRMKDLGILMSTDGKDINVLKIKPPIVFSKENADEFLLRLKTVFREDFMIK